MEYHTALLFELFLNASLSNMRYNNMMECLMQVVFPMLFPRDEDVRLFDEDPIDYIRKGGQSPPPHLNPSIRTSHQALFVPDVGSLHHPPTNQTHNRKLFPILAQARVRWRSFTTPRTRRWG